MANIPIRGLVHATGEPDSGKTTFALSTGVAPNEIVMLDDDLKGQTVADSLAEVETPLGLYHNLHREFSSKPGSKPVVFHNMVYEILTKIPTGKFKVLIFDNWSRMEAGIRARSLEIMKDISDLTPGQIRNMSQLTWPYTYNYYAEVLDLMLSKASLVFVTTHIREQYIGNQKTGKWEPRGQRPLAEKSSLRVWLRHNPDGPQPIGLVLKRIMQMRATDDGLQPVNILPRRVKPCTWKRIREYLAEPMGNREPTAEETPNAFELSVLDGTLTDDQKDTLRLARLAAEGEGSTPVRQEVEVKKPESQPVTVIFTAEQRLEADNIRSRFDEDTPNFKIASEIAGEMGLSLPQANQLLKSLDERTF